MKPPNDLAFMLAAGVGVLGACAFGVLVSALMKSSLPPRARNVLKFGIAVGVGLLATAFYMAGWGFVFPKK